MPERIGGTRNYDYRLAWIRNAGCTIISFLHIGAEAEAKAALTWLLGQLTEHGSRVCFRLGGGLDEDLEELDLPGYRHSRPVVRGNIAGRRHQHGVYGGIFETVAAFIGCGNVIDARSCETLPTWPTNAPTCGARRIPASGNCPSAAITPCPRSAAGRR